MWECVSLSVCVCVWQCLRAYELMLCLIRTFGLCFSHSLCQLKCLLAVTSPKSAVITLTSGCLLTSSPSPAPTPPSLHHTTTAVRLGSLQANLLNKISTGPLLRGLGATGNCGGPILNTWKSFWRTAGFAKMPFMESVWALSKKYSLLLMKALVLIKEKKLKTWIKIFFSFFFLPQSN